MFASTPSSWLRCVETRGVERRRRKGNGGREGDGTGRRTGEFPSLRATAHNCAHDSTRLRLDRRERWSTCRMIKPAETTQYQFTTASTRLLCLQRARKADFTAATGVLAAGISRPHPANSGRLKTSRGDGLIEHSGTYQDLFPTLLYLTVHLFGFFFLPRTFHRPPRLELT